jgi:hypothetical protein
MRPRTGSRMSCGDRSATAVVLQTACRRGLFSRAAVASYEVDRRGERVRDRVLHYVVRSILKTEARVGTAMSSFDD